MTKAKHLSRLLCLVLAAVMVLGLAVLPTPAKAGYGSMGNGTTLISCGVQMCTCSGAGTDANVFLRIYYVDDNGNEDYQETKMKSSVNDFESGDWRVYETTFSKPYYYITGFAIRHEDLTAINDAMNIEYVKFGAYADGGGDPFKYFTWDPAGECVELNDSQVRINIDQSNSDQRSKRVVTAGSSAYTTFRNTFNQTVYFDSTRPSGQETVTWNGNVDSDGVYPFSYNPFLYASKPTLSLSVKAYLSDNSLSAADSGLTALFTKQTGDGAYGFTYDTGKVWDAMVEADLYAIQVEVTETFPKATSSKSDDRSETAVYKIYRRQFEVDDPTVSSSYYTAPENNYFFNSEHTEIELTIPVAGGDYHSNYNSSKIAETLAAQEYRLYYGGSSYLTGTKTFSGSSIILTFPIGNVKYETLSGSSNLILYMKGVTGSYDSRSYTLYDAASVGQPLPGGSTTTAAGDYYHVLTGYKLDNIPPNLYVREEGCTDAQPFSHKWQRNVTLYTRVEKGNPSELLYAVKGSSQYEGQLQIQLKKGYDTTVFTILNDDGTTPNVFGNFMLIPTTDFERKSTITLRDAKEVTADIVLTVWDFAGNNVVLNIADAVYLDKLPPTVSISSDGGVLLADKSRNYSFTFKVTEGTNTAKVRYCVVMEDENHNIPDPPAENTYEDSGVINENFGHWAFLEQSSGNLTAVLKLMENETFTGAIYYYAEDEAGNTSKNPDYQMEEIRLTNVAAAAEVVVSPDPIDHPLPNYDIMLRPLQGSAVESYRYSRKLADGSYEPVTDWIEYPVSGHIGSAQVDENTLLNGTYVLEYQVQNDQSGNHAVYEGIAGYELIFDNSDPELSVTRTSTGSSLAAQSFRLTAEDISGIASARYEVKAAGTGDVAASGDLPIADGTYLLNTDLSTMEMGLANGAYTLTLYATDRNNTTVSETSEVFTVRTQAPAAEITLNGAPVSGTAAVNDPMYKLGLTVTDAFAGTPGSQSVYWRVSDGGTDFTPWQKLTDMTAADGVLSALGELTAPLALADGLNTVRLQLLCAESAKNMSGEDISAESILSLDILQILLDTTAPTARWSAASGRSNTGITGTLTVSDNYCAAPAVAAVTSNLTVTPSDSGQNTYTVQYTHPAGAAKPDKLVVAVTDDAGNVNSFEIAADLLDIEGPQIDIAAPVYQVYGDRQDALVTVTVTEEYPGPVDFDLDPAAEKYVLIQQPSTDVWTVWLRGYTGDMPFTVTAADDLGNTTTAVSGAITVKYAEIAQPQIIGEPAYAYDSALTVLRFNLPAAAAATEEEALALAEGAGMKPGDYLKGSCLLVPDEMGEGKRPCTVWVADGFGSAKRFTLTPDTIFGKDLPVTVIPEQYVDGVKVDGTPTALVAGTHIADPSDPTDSDREYTALVAVEAAAGGEPSALFPYTILAAADERSGSNQPAEPVEGTAKARIASCDPEDYDSKDTLLAFLPHSPESELDPYGLCVTVFDVSFSRMAFAVSGGDAAANLPSAELNIGAYMQGEPYADDAEAVGQTVFIRLPYADRMSFSGTYTVTGDTAPYTLAAGVSGSDVWLNKNLKLDFPFITAAPVITYKSWQNTIAPQVEFTASADGRGAKLTQLKLLKKEADGSWTVAAIWSVDNGDSGSGTLSCVIPEEEAGTYCLYALNEYGLSTLSEEIAISVYSEPIDETDYTLLIYADVNGSPVPVTGEEPYSNTVTVRIEPTAEGLERGLYAMNCDENMEAVLTPDSRSFTFQLTDKYGYTLEVPVSYSHFDTVAPTLAYTLPDVGKTNKAYAVTVTAEDKESGVSFVTLTGPRGSVSLAELDGVWTGQIPENGTYLIAAEDKLGNRTQLSFTVSNIDTTLPNASITRSVPEGVWTLQPVTVSVSFDKPNVLITKVEKASGELTQNKTKKTLTFSTNGAATVFYRDDYGNEGSILVTVNNIYSEPPRVAAVPVLSEDELSVSVTFEMERGADGAPLDLVRDLSQLTVIHNGVAYRADEAVYRLGENGTYTFTVIDEVGLMQVIKLTVSDIDRSAPRITEVRWTYVYYDDEGREHNATYNLSSILGSIQGAGYRVASDLYPVTNQNVTVTVTTDVPTSIIGSYGGERTSDHTLVYYENGMYIYNLEKRNGLSTHYGVDVEIIDKTPPVITLENPEYLMFIENRDTGDFTAMLNDYTAIDTYLGIETDLTDAVTVDYGGLIADDLSKNTFDKSHPYTVTYSVKDAAGNEMQVTRTVVLIGINDVLVTVNGRLPSASSMAEARDGNVKLELVNFSGVSYVTYAKGMFTFGQMKRTGTLLAPQADGSFLLTNLPDGWYTFFVQTETRDYFNIYVYVG